MTSFPIPAIVSNNTHDLWEEMRFALLLQRAVQEDVEAVTACDILLTLCNGETVYDNGIWLTLNQSAITEYTTVVRRKIRQGT